MISKTVLIVLFLELGNMIYQSISNQPLYSTANREQYHRQWGHGNRHSQVARISDPHQQLRYCLFLTFSFNKSFLQITLASRKPVLQMVIWEVQHLASPVLRSITVSDFKGYIMICFDIMPLIGIGAGVKDFKI